MKSLGANTIRVYHVDASGDHTGCMSAFADAGIYLFVDLDTFETQINQVCEVALDKDSKPMTNNGNRTHRTGI
jgi:hypothetical protein